jgi:hypothetical protein
MDPFRFKSFEYTLSVGLLTVAVAAFAWYVLTGDRW